MNNYQVEIDGQVIGTVNAQNFNDAAMAVMWSYATQCTTLVVYRTDKPEQTSLYAGVEMTSPLNMHSRRFTSFQHRADLDAYLQALSIEESKEEPPDETREDDFVPKDW